jgi:ankyrin repeat protein
MFFSTKTLPVPHKQYGMYYIEEALRDACYQGDISQIKNLTERYPDLNINAANEYAETALYIACKRNQVNAVKFLLDQPNININQATILGNSPLLIAAWNDNTELAKLLLDHNADANHCTNKDRPYHGGVNAADIAKERGNEKLFNHLQQFMPAESAKDTPSFSK